MFLFELWQHFLCFLHAAARRSPLPARPPRPQKRWQVRSTVLAELTEPSVGIFTPGSSALWRKEVETRAPKPGFFLFKSAKWSTFCTFGSPPLNNHENPIGNGWENGARRLGLEPGGLIFNKMPWIHTTFLIKGSGSFFHF